MNWSRFVFIGRHLTWMCTFCTKRCSGSLKCSGAESWLGGPCSNSRLISRSNALWKSRHASIPSLFPSQGLNTTIEKSTNKGHDWERIAKQCLFVSFVLLVFWGFFLRKTKYFKNWICKLWCSKPSWTLSLRERKLNYKLSRRKRDINSLSPLRSHIKKTNV